MGRFLHTCDAAGGASYMRLFYQAHWVANALCGLGIGRASMAAVQAAPARAYNHA